MQKKHHRLSRALAFYHAKQAATAVEFAIVSLVFFAFILLIVNLGLLGFTANALSHGVQAATRKAAVAAANNYVNSSEQTYTCPSSTAIAGYFDGIADPPLSPSSTTTGANPYIHAAWSYNGSNLPPGVVLLLTATEQWSPIGFARFGLDINLKISTLATVMGTTTASASAISSSCGNS
jgi:hypothetical protein